MSPPDEVRVRVARRRRRADEWALVLLSEGLHPRLREAPEGFALEVPAQEAQLAARVLHEYDREESEGPPPALHFDLEIGGLVGLALLVFFLALGGADPLPRFLERGVSDAERVLAGELWRTVTALTLHADLRHVGGNAAASTILLGAVCGALGRGIGLALVVAAGALGNALNALLYRADHVSLGASTAVFGALGILVGLSVRSRHRRRIRGRRFWAPIGAGLALLAFLGTGEGRVDIWAHLWGLVAGAGLGLAVAFTPADQARPTTQRLVLAATLLATLGCWLLALA